MSNLFPEVRTQEMIDELERELTMRQMVYPRQVRHRMLSQSVADRRIAIIEAIIARLRLGQGGAP